MKNSKYLILLTHQIFNKSKTIELKTNDETLKDSFIKSILEKQKTIVMDEEKIKVILQVLIWNENFKQYELDDIYTV